MKYVCKGEGEWEKAGMSILVVGIRVMMMCISVVRISRHIKGAEDEAQEEDAEYLISRLSILHQSSHSSSACPSSCQPSLSLLVLFYGCRR